MAKQDSKTYQCTECENITSRHYGKCVSCGAFGSIVEIANQSETVKIASVGLKTSAAIKPPTKARTVSQLNSQPLVRTPTGIDEFDRVIGGGFVEAQVVLLAAPPGAGKSTLCLSVADKLGSMGKTVLYSSGEESEQQIGFRAKRMQVHTENIKVTSETSIEVLLGHIDDEKPDFVVVDSLQTLASTEIPGSVGSLSQSREAANTLTRIAKSQNITMILINQVAKSGDFAGSNAIQHIVDTTLMLESDSETPLRFLRAEKNRFGETDEIGVFQHSELGLEGVSDPSGVFLETQDDDATGAACSFLSEGMRHIPIEVQSLVTQTTLPTPRKQFSGVNHQRGQIVCAILDKFCNAKLYDNDVFVSTVAGIRVDDPQSDLAMAAAILSSVNEIAIPNDISFIGELSLTGRVRGKFRLESKVSEAERLGFTTVLVPYGTYTKKTTFRKLTVLPVSSVTELDKYLRSLK